MSAKEEVRRRTELLKKLREEHKETVARTQALLKEQKKVNQQICQAIQENARTVPEVAQATGLPAHEVLWHITAMKKYGLVLETGMGDEYYLYQTAKEAAE